MRKGFVFSIVLIVLICLLGAVQADEFYTVYYSDTDEGHFSDITTEVPLGEEYVTIMTINQLGEDYAENGRNFIGWKAYNPNELTWYAQDIITEQRSWQQTDANGNLPDGYDYYLYVNGAGVRKQTTAGGRINLYAQWEIGSYTLYYSESDDDAFSDETTEVPLGTEYTTILSIEALEFDTTSRVFLGWKAYNPNDQTWYAQDIITKQRSWQQTDANGNLPDGYDYYLYANGAGVRKQTAADGRINLYAQWETGSYTIYYSESDDDVFSDETTEVPLGTGYTTILSIEALEFDTTGRIFLGWKAYNPNEQTWYTQDIITEQRSWQQTDANGNLPDGYDYYLFVNEAGVRKQVSAGGRVNFYAQWNTDGNDIYYYESEDGQPSDSYTHLATGVVGKLLTLEELGIQPNGRIFLGWKAQRVSDGFWVIGNTWKEAPDNGEDYYLYHDGEELAGYRKTGEIHFYAQWLEPPFDVTTEYFGAAGTDSNDDRAAIQKALNLALKTAEPITVFIPAGHYYISGPLVIYSDTTLSLDSGAIISNLNGTDTMLFNEKMPSTALEEAGHYNRSKNIQIVGGTWDGNGQSGDKAISLIVLTHAQNVSISGITVKNCCGNHFIDFAGVKNVTITGCTFRDFVKLKGVNYDDTNQNGMAVSVISEAIQLDYATETSSGEVAQPYDGTGCENVTVTGCSFINCQSGIGNHHLGELTYGYVFKNNTFTGMGSSCINLYSVGEAEIRENTINQSTGMLRLYQCGSSATENRRITIQSNNGTGNRKGSGIFILESQGVVVKDNEISDFLNGIQVCQDSANISVTNNTVDGTTEDGILMADSKNDGNEIKNNTILNATTNGIRVANSAALVETNIIDDVSEIGIKVSDSEATDVQDNTISNTASFGVRVTRSECTLKNNTISMTADSGISVVKMTGDILQNRITGTMDGYNIVTYDNSSGKIEANTYDLPYGIMNYGNMNRTINNYLYADEEINYFTIVYHRQNNAIPESETTIAVYGEGAKTKTIAEMGIEQEDNLFLGWRLYRNDLRSWGIQDDNGNLTWKRDVAQGDQYLLYKDGAFMKTTVEKGVELHLFAQWEHDDRNDEPLTPGKMILSSSLLEIGDEAFRGMSAIMDVTVGSRTTRIGSLAFADMPRLKYITIPNSVTFISEDAFSNSNVTIRCAAESYARRYAEANNLRWEENTP